MCGGSFVRTVPLISQVITVLDKLAVQNNWTTEPVAMFNGSLKGPVGSAMMVISWPLTAEGREESYKYSWA